MFMKALTKTEIKGRVCVCVTQLLMFSPLLILPNINHLIYLSSSSESAHTHTHKGLKYSLPLPKRHIDLDHALNARSFCR